MCKNAILIHKFSETSIVSIPSTPSPVEKKNPAYTTVAGVPEGGGGVTRAMPPVDRRVNFCFKGEKVGDWYVQLHIYNLQLIINDI